MGSRSLQQDLLLVKRKRHKVRFEAGDFGSGECCQYAISIRALLWRIQVGSRGRTCPIRVRLRTS